MRTKALLFLLAISTYVISAAEITPSQDSLLRLSEGGLDMVSAKSGKGREFLRLSEMRVNPLSGADDFVVSPDYLRILFKVRGNSDTASYYVYKVESNRCDPLTEAPGAKNPAFSPDGKKIAFSRGGDVFIKRLEYGAEIRVTEDGPEGICNGSFSEDYAAAFGRDALMEFSPDGMYLLFAKDNKAFLYSIQYKWTKEIPIPEGCDAHYVLAAAWSADGEAFWLSALNKKQDEHYIIRVNSASLVSKCLYRYAAKPYVSPEAAGFIAAADKGGALMLSEKDGRRKLLRLGDNGAVRAEFSPSGGCVGRVYGTAGGKIYYSVVSPSAYGCALECAPISGGKAERILAAEAAHDLRFICENSRLLIRSENPDGSGELYAATLSGKKLASFELRPAHPGRSLVVLDSMMIELTKAEGGARGLMLLADAYGGGEGWAEIFASLGYDVARVLETERPKEGVYKNMCLYYAGRYAEAARLLRENGYAPEGRVYLIGQGFSATAALMTAVVDSSAVDAIAAIAPVSGPEHYNPVLTERLMLTPGASSAYRLNSPEHNAAKLNVPLLLVHAADDKDCPLDNTYRLAAALVAAGRQFRMQIYPFAGSELTDSLGSGHLVTLVKGFFN